MKKNILICLLIALVLGSLFCIHHLKNGSQKLISSHMEVEAMRHLSNIYSGQNYFKALRFKDKDNDGIGEFGDLHDLAFRCFKPFINGYVGLGEENGYLYEMHLSDSTDENENGYWVCAYPREMSTHNFRTFYIDESGLLKGKHANGKKVESKEEGRKFMIYSGSGAFKMYSEFLFKNGRKLERLYSPILLNNKIIKPELSPKR